MVTSDNLRLTMNMFAKEVHQNAVDHGWWVDPRSFGELIALCHEELSEALREYRNGHRAERNIPWRGRQTGGNPYGTC